MLRNLQHLQVRLGDSEHKFISWPCTPVSYLVSSLYTLASMVCSRAIGHMETVVHQNNNVISFLECKLSIARPFLTIRDGLIAFSQEEFNF